MEPLPSTPQEQHDDNNRSDEGDFERCGRHHFLESPADSKNRARRCTTTIVLILFSVVYTRTGAIDAQGHNTCSLGSLLAAPDVVVF